MLTAYKNIHNLSIFDYIKKMYFLASAKIILTTHASYKLKKSQIHFQLWHAMMIKKTGAMVLKPNEKFKHTKDWKKADYILSYSETYTTICNSMMTTDPRKYKIFGAPRNDFLFQKNGEQILNNFIKLKHFKNKIIICPTMRFENSTLSDYVSLNNYSIYDLFTTKNNINFYDDETLIVIKPHPHDEDIVNLNSIKLPKNVIFLTDKKLGSLGVDFYETLNAFDLLITDYSSVFYDFLLLDKPMIFYDPLIDDVKENRGLIFESVESFLPGDVCKTIEDLKIRIAKNLKGEKEIIAKEKRKKMLNFIHRYKDGNSTQRIEKFLQKLLNLEKSF